MFCVNRINNYIVSRILSHIHCYMNTLHQFNDCLFYQITFIIHTNTHLSTYAYNYTVPSVA